MPIAWFVLAIYLSGLLVLLGVELADLAKGTGWTITLNRPGRTFECVLKAGPFVRRSVGTFDDILSFQWESNIGMYPGKPYTVYVTFRKNVGRERFDIESTFSWEDALIRTEELNDWLSHP